MYKKSDLKNHQVSAVYGQDEDLLRIICNMYNMNTPTKAHSAPNRNVTSFNPSMKGQWGAVLGDSTVRKSISVAAPIVRFKSTPF